MNSIDVVKVLSSSYTLDVSRGKGAIVIIFKKKFFFACEFANVRKKKKHSVVNIKKSEITRINHTNNHNSSIVELNIISR